MIPFCLNPSGDIKMNPEIFMLWTMRKLSHMMLAGFSWKGVLSRGSACVKETQYVQPILLLWAIEAARETKTKPVRDSPNSDV